MSETSNGGILRYADLPAARSCSDVHEWTARDRLGQDVTLRFVCEKPSGHADMHGCDPEVIYNTEWPAPPSSNEESEG